MTGPKWSRGSLDVINNTFVVQNGMIYEYYPISVKPYDKDDKFIELEISPGIRSPGKAIIAKNVYDVSLADLERRRINVSKRINEEVGRNTSDTASKAKSSKPKASNNEQRSVPVSGRELTKAADVAWEDQVESLLETFYSKEGEEFEITGSAQSRQVDEDSAVSGIFTDLEQD
jgi:hypothetical protein